LEIWRPYLSNGKNGKKNWKKNWKKRHISKRVKLRKKNHFFSFFSHGRHKSKTEKVTFIGGFFHVVAVSAKPIRCPNPKSPKLKKNR
jgi:hypothetical protein